MIPEHSLVGLFLRRYRIWQDHQKFYHKIDQPNLFDNLDFDYFDHRDISGINSSKKDLILVNNLSEGFHTSYRRFFLRYDTNKRYIIFSNGGNCDTTSKKLNFCYKPIFHLYYLMEFADTYLSPHRFCFYSDQQFDFECEKPYLFVSTIGALRSERDYLVDKLQKNFLNRNVLVKYNGQCVMGDDHGLDVKSFGPGEFNPHIELLPGYYHHLSQALPINLYNLARFKLVVESDLVDTDQFHLTEKTITCLLSGTPFVMVAAPNFLKNIQNLGFRTYHNFWDESYDQIIDYQTRIDAILDVCRDLAGFDWQKNMSELKAIGNHNRQIFSRLASVAAREFDNMQQTMIGDWIYPNRSDD